MNRTARPPDREIPLRFHGRRRGRPLRAGRRLLLDEMLPRLRVTLPAGGELLDLRSLFDRPVREVWLEVGFGAGEHLIGQAVAHPDVGFIGCEPYVNGVASALAQIARHGLTNVRIHDDDARALLHVLPEAGIGRVFLLFSDPWPKRRHHHRRLVGPATLDALTRVLTDGGDLCFATDHPGYVRWTLQKVTAHRDFAWAARRPADWRERPADWLETRYEAKARTRGASCVYLRFVRRARRKAAEPG